MNSEQDVCEVRGVITESVGMNSFLIILFQMSTFKKCVHTFYCYSNTISADCLQHPQSKCIATPTQVFPQLSTLRGAVYLMKG